MRQKGVIMSQLFTTGKVISNLELKASAKQNLYIHFTLVEQIGYGEQMHSQFIHVWAWGYQAEQLKRLGVRKGSIIWVSGALELEEFVNRDGSTRDIEGVFHHTLQLVNLANLITLYNVRDGGVIDVTDNGVDFVLRVVLQMGHRKAAKANIVR